MFVIINLNLVRTSPITWCLYMNCFGKSRKIYQKTENSSSLCSCQNCEETFAKTDDYSENDQNFRAEVFGCLSNGWGGRPDYGFMTGN